MTWQGYAVHVKWESRWWFQIFFIFTPTWGNDPIWLTFSDGLKPPTRSRLFLFFKFLLASLDRVPETNLLQEATFLGKKPHQSILIWGKLMIWVYWIGLKPCIGKLLVLLAHFPRLWVLRNWKNSKRILAIMVLPFGDTYIIYVYISYIHWKWVRERERDPRLRDVGRCWWFKTLNQRRNTNSKHHERL